MYVNALWVVIKPGLIIGQALQKDNYLCQETTVLVRMELRFSWRVILVQHFILPQSHFMIKI